MPPRPLDWSPMRRARRRYFLALLAMAVALPSLDVLGRRVGQGPAAVATVAVLAVAFIAGLRFARAPCARCGQPFFMPSVMNVLRSTCVHCGVAQWAEVDPGDGA